MAFGDDVLTFRAENNLTQVETADILGVTVGMISRYECGQSAPSKINQIRFKKRMDEWQTANNKTES